MSRIVVKNLPKTITEEKLRGLFETKGQITDVQLKYTKEGVFRQFAFIGFQNESDAAEAIKYFDQSRINTTKISVQECATLGHESKPKSWSKYASDSSAFKKLHKKDEKDVVQDGEGEDKGKNKKTSSKEAKTKELLMKYKDDPLFNEFLQVHSAQKAQKILKTAREEDDEDSGNVESVPEPDEDEDDIDGDVIDKLANNNISDEDYLNLLKTKKPRKKMEKKPKVKVDFFNVKLTNLPYICTKRDIKDFMRPVPIFSIRIPRHIKGIAFLGFKDEKKYNKALLKDKSIIKGNQIRVVKYEKTEMERAQMVNPKWQTQEETIKNEEGIAESGRIFLRNLSYTTTEDDIQKMFETYGPIAELNLPVDSSTRKMKGFGVITFVMPEHAVKAYSDLDGKILHGRMLHLLPGKPKDEGGNEDDEDSNNFKKKKEKQQKAQAGSAHNWNSLFLGHDAVADVIASTHNTTKETVLSPHGKGSAAVRLALGETQIVATTRKYLEEHGVFLDAFVNVNVKRSKTVILVKNLPANTQSYEIRDLFQKYGVIGRLIFPPSAISAIVEFLEPSEARKAFTNLAYKKFKHLPLYLEWAPENVMKENATKADVVEADDYNRQNMNAIKENPQKMLDASVRKDLIQEMQVETQEVEEDDEPEPDTTIFVKNLNFKTTDIELREHFAQCGKINYATVASKKDPSNPKNILSMGYGFVRFVHKASADNALKNMQFSNLAGRTLELKRSERTLPNEVNMTRRCSKATKQTGTKILVRNIPFQANRNEVMELFKTFGEIKALRLPKKMTTVGDSHRGFAFVDFATNSDAKKAFEALSQSTHLYGRRLALEWAQKEEDVDEIRKRTADHFHEKEVVRSKKSVFDIEEK